jgi:hypothetical protein
VVETPLLSNQPRCDQTMQLQLNTRPDYATQCYGWLGVLKVRCEGGWLADASQAGEHAQKGDGG